MGDLNWTNSPPIDGGSYWFDPADGEERARVVDVDTTHTDVTIVRDPFHIPDTLGSMQRRHPACRWAGPIRKPA